ncbi:hypothetical protein CsatA_021299 [Cannabis sativa]
MILWRVCTNSLPTRDKVGCGSETICPLCNSDIETPWHLFVKCPFTSALWFAGPLPLCVSNIPETEMVEFIANLCNNANYEMRTAILIYSAIILETSWKYRNQVIHSPSAVQLCINRALANVVSRFHEMTPKVGQHTRMEVSLPEPPPSLSISTDRVVIVDGSFDKGCYGCAMVFQTRGSADWVWGSNAGTCFNALAAELEAIRYAMLWAVNQHVKEVSIVSDSKILVQALNQKKCPDWHLFATFTSVLSLLSSFTVCNFMFVKRCFISNVDKLANESRHSRSSSSNCKGEGFPPVNPIILWS